MKTNLSMPSLLKLTRTRNTLYMRVLIFKNLLNNLIKKINNNFHSLIWYYSDISETREREMKFDTVDKIVFQHPETKRSRIFFDIPLHSRKWDCRGGKGTRLVWIERKRSAIHLDREIERREAVRDFLNSAQRGIFFEYWYWYWRDTCLCDFK